MSAMGGKRTPLLPSPLQPGASCTDKLMSLIVKHGMGIPLDADPATSLEDKMSDLANHYGGETDKARADAGAASLPNVRQLHLQSAERLDQIISGIVSVAQAKARNEEAKGTAS